MSESLWGDLTSLNKIETPIKILREQATILTQNTRGSLVGNATISVNGGNFELELQVIVPALNEYIFCLVTVRHDVSIYPVRVFPNNGGAGTMARDINEFRTVLKDILGSIKTRQLLERLMSQATE